MHLTLFSCSPEDNTSKEMLSLNRNSFNTFKKFSSALMHQKGSQKHTAVLIQKRPTTALQPHPRNIG